MLIPFQKLQNRFQVKPKGVLHVGANIGEEAQAYERAGIKKVIWIEANGDIFLKLRENVKKYPGHQCVLACVGDENGNEVIFHIANNNGQSSSYLDLGTHKQQHPTVHYIEDVPMITRRIDDLGLDLTDVDYLSMDIQGAELLALRGMGELLRQFKWAYLEINQNEVYKGCPHVNDIDLFMNGFGFKRVITEMCGNWGDALYVKK